MKKTVKIHMLPTEDNSRLFIRDDRLQHCCDGGSMVANEEGWDCQHLYFTASEVKELP